MKTITLLDGTEHKIPDLLDKMESDEFYYGYLGKAALSSSSIKKLLYSPRAYQDSLESSSAETKALREGKLIHALLLEPQKAEAFVSVDVSTRATKKFKEAVAEHGVDNVFTETELSMARRLVNRLKECEEAYDLVYGAATEIPAIGDIMGKPFRAKADILHKGLRIVDLKTTGNGLHKFKYAAYDFGYDAQAAIYTHLFQIERFTFLVLDKSTGDIGIYETSEEFINSGKKKVARAVEYYQKYFEQGEAISSFVHRGTL